jgi:tetratricopeptide (TPR) repeat protein
VTAIIAGMAASPAYAQVAKGSLAEASALALNHRSKELYQQGRYAEAVALLREAYRLKSEPVLQYNLAHACEKMADYPCAIAAYESYLASAETSADRAAIEAQLASCRARLAAETAMRAEPPPPPPPPPLEPTEPPPPSPAEPSPLVPAAGLPLLPGPEPRRPSQSVLPPIVGVAAVAGIGAGLGLVWAARAKHEDAVHDPTQRGAEQKQERAESLMRAGNLALIAGGAVATGGIVWWIFNARSDHSVAPKSTGTISAIHISARSVALSLIF